MHIIDTVVPFSNIKLLVIKLLVYHRGGKYEHGERKTILFFHRLVVSFYYVYAFINI